jgi:hypothetical protein
MPTTIKLKNSVTTTNVPSSLAQGEVAINVTDKKVWVGNAATTPVQLLGTGSDGSFTNLTVSGTTALNGGATLGDASGDALTINSSAVSIPNGLNFDSNTLVIDATNNNVSIGATSNPVSKFGVTTSSAGAFDLYRTGAAGEVRLSFFNDNASSSAVVAGRVGGVLTTTTAGSEDGALLFSTTSAGATAEKMRIDSSGNVGLGVTPSAWAGAGVKAIDVGTRAAFYSGGGGQPIIANNFYFNGTNNIYKTTSAAGYYQISTGVHSWGIAPSGTAGTTATITQAMTLTAGGNLGLGTTSPNVGAASAGNVVLTLTGTGAERSGIIELQAPSNSTDSYATGLLRFYNGTNENARIEARTQGTVNDAANLRFFTRATGGSITERMRITSDGYLRMASGSGGIQFNGDTAAGNALDDYEEGTFTPVIQGTTTAGTGTYTAQVGRYTKIGNRVSASIYLAWTAHTGTGNMRISSLPYATPNVTDIASACSVISSNITSPASTIVVGQVNQNSSLVILYSQAIATSAINFLALDTSGGISVNVVYEAA